MQQVHQKGTEEASRALATLFEAHSETMIPLLNIVVEAKVTPRPDRGLHRRGQAVSCRRPLPGSQARHTEGVEKTLLWTGTADTQAASAIAAPLTAFLDTWKARSGATFRAPI